METMKIFKKIKAELQKDKKENACNAEERELLKIKVIEGTDFAIHKYGEVFKKLAEYDKNLN